MKSRWTTYLLLAAVTAVWGIVAWKIFAPSGDPLPAAHPKLAVPAAVRLAVDPLRLDYPDPFLKGVPRHVVAARPAVRSLPVPKAAAPKRERVKIAHLGTVTAAGQQLHILTVGDQQYELRCGDSAGGFVLADSDVDSLYLCKDGVTYGVKRCAL